MTDEVFFYILGLVLDGTYGPGARLPAERDWARDAGASRVTVRAALSRLSDWNVIEIRRGSGAVVKPRRKWSFDVMPEWIKRGGASDGMGVMAMNLLDALELRRMITVHLVAKAATRAVPGALAPARPALHRAWEARDDAARFAELDVEMTRCALEAGRLLSAQWILNAFAKVYLKITSVVPAAAIVPEDYVSAYERAFDCIEANDAAGAAETLREYFERHDALIVQTAAASLLATAAE